MIQITKPNLVASLAYAKAITVKLNQKNKVVNPPSSGSTDAVCVHLNQKKKESK